MQIKCIKRIPARPLRTSHRTMRLTLSSGSPWHCDYYNQYRQVLFKVAPLGRLPFGVYITISRVVPPRADGPRRALETIGGFYWDGSKETRIKYRGEDQHVKQFFRNLGLSPLRRNEELICTVSDKLTS